MCYPTLQIAQGKVCDLEQTADANCPRQTGGNLWNFCLSEYCVMQLRLLPSNAWRALRYMSLSKASLVFSRLESCIAAFCPGNKVEKVCELAHITLNKNAVFGDSSALSPGGVRIGECSVRMLLLLISNLG